MKHSLLPISLLSTIILSGCLEVDNDSNDELVTTLQEQNQILIDNQNQVFTVDLKGLVVDAYDGQPITAAQITVKQAETILIDNLAVTNGEFQLPALPASTDLEIIISDNNNTFMQRVFFVRTSSATTNGKTSDIGILEVSEAITVTLDITDTVTNEAYSELTFKGYSHSGSSSSINNYMHTSTFADGVYTIVLPKHLPVTITANLDADRDGNADFTTSPSNYENGNSLQIYQANLSELYNIELTPQEASINQPKDVEYRISIIDSSANTITGAELVISDLLNGAVRANYDDATQQYVLNAKYQDFINIEIPSFTSNDISYQSSSIQLSDSNDEIYVYVSNSNNNNSSFYTTELEVIELALSPRVITNNSTLEVAYRQTEISGTDQSFSVFYSAPISIDESNVSLTDRYGFSVIKGDSSTDDLVLAGTTLITGNIEIPLALSLSLNNTKLTLTPQESLVGGNFYEYNIGSIEALSNGIIDDIYNDDLSFNAESSVIETFNINDIILDNESYTTNGTSIISANTAGEVASNSNNDRNVYIYLPQSIQSLNSFTLRKRIVVEENVSRTDAGTYTIVNNGSVNINSYGLVQTASNENIVSDNVSKSIIHSTVIADTTLIYRQATNEYLSDNLSTSENSIAFEYAYETKAGEVFTGNITLPVQ